MLGEDLEFQISQYADGSLPVEQRLVVEELVRSDAEAAKILRDYQKLDLHFAGMRGGPVVRWDRLAEHLSDAVRTEEAEASRPVIAGRIFPAIASWQFRSAVAAVVVFAVGGVLLFKGHRSHPQVGPVQPSADSTAFVSGPQAEVANGPASQNIQIGPSPALAQRLGSWRYADGVVTHGPSKVTITAGITPPPPRKDLHTH